MGSGGRLPVHGLSAADVPSEITPDAARTHCCLGGQSTPGFGYAGGGFGPYRTCLCGRVFAKTSARDGNH